MLNATYLENGMKNPFNSSKLGINWSNGTYPPMLKVKYMGYKNNTELICLAIKEIYIDGNGR